MVVDAVAARLRYQSRTGAAVFSEGLGIFRSVNELEGENVSCIPRSHRLSADHTICNITVITDFNVLPTSRMRHRIMGSTTRAEEGSAFRDWPYKGYSGFHILRAKQHHPYGFLSLLATSNTPSSSWCTTGNRSTPPNGSTWL